MFDNKYPYTDFHELNLDWFLAEFKKVPDKVTTLDATVQEFTTFVPNYFENHDVQQEINNKLDAMAADGSLAALIQPLFDEYKTEIDGIVSDQNTSISNQNTKISILEGRMDEFSTLTDGSTTGDAELADARVSYTGYTYPNAGDAVRGQTLANHNAILQTLMQPEVEETITTVAGYYKNTGFVSNASFEAAEYIPTPGDAIRISCSGNSTFKEYYFYDANNNVLASGTGNVAISDYNVIVPLGAALLGLNYLTTSGNKKTKPKVLKYDNTDPTVWIKEAQAGREWIQLVEKENKSGAQAGQNNYTENGNGVTGYVTKVYDVQNINKAKLYADNVFAIYGTYFDGTNTLNLKSGFSFPATGQEFDCIKYREIIITALQAEFWASNYIRLEGYTNTNTKWTGKEIVWFGTSIPAGGFIGANQPQSYPFLVERLLNSKVYNEAVGSSAVHACELSRISSTNPYGFIANFETASRALSNSTQMMVWIANWADYKCNGGTYGNDEPWDPDVFTSHVPATWTSDDTDRIKSFSYMAKIDQYLLRNKIPDLFVFDHGYNDNIANSDHTGSYEAAIAAGYTRDNVFSFRGAMNLLIDHILSFNPSAKICMIGDYDNQYPSKKYDAEYQAIVAEDYEIPLFERWKYMGYSQRTETAHYTWSSGLLTYTSGATETHSMLEWSIPDHIHPHTDKTGKCLADNAKVIAEFLKEI